MKKLIAFLIIGLFTIVAIIMSCGGNGGDGSDGDIPILPITQGPSNEVDEYLGHYYLHPRHLEGIIET